MENIQDALTLAVYNVFAKLVSFVPQLLAAAFVLLLGNIISKWARWVTIKLVRTLGISKALKDSPVEKFLEKAEVTQKIEDVSGNIIRWLIFLIFFVAAVNILGLTTVSAFLNNILSYIPNIIAAVLIIVVGTVIAGFVESLIKGSVSHLSVSTARLVSKISSYIVMIFSVLAALAQLGIAENLINILFIGLVAMLALGFGLAFGLGAKDLVSKILDEWYTNLKQDKS